MPYRKKALIAGIAACFAVSSGAYAQDATSAPAPTPTPAPAPAATDSTSTSDQAKQLQGVTVTGIRASLKKSLDRKRDNDAITEVITAEDIGKLPATNTAEALAQMPGVTLDHLFGADQRVSIDGLDPSLNLSFLDGHPLSQALWRYADIPNRGFNFSLLPPEILGSVEVYKTPEARLIEGSLGGTILMHTVQPLDLPANTLRASTGVNYNDMANKGRPDEALFYSWRTADRTFGVDVAAQHYEEITDRQGEEIFSYTPLSTVAQSNTYVKNAIAAGQLSGNDVMPNEINAADFQQTEKRDSINVNLQYKPVSNIELGSGLIWMQDHLDNLNNSMYAFMLNAAPSITSLNVGSNGVVSSGTSGTCNIATTPGCSPGANTTYDNNARQSLITTQGFDLHGTYKGDGWKVYSQVGMSNSHNVLTQAAIETNYTGGYSWDINRGFNFDSQTNALDPHNWLSGGGFGSYAQEPYSARDLFGQGDFTKDFDGFVNQLLVGVRYAIHHEGQSIDSWSDGVSTVTDSSGTHTISLADVGAGGPTNLRGLNSMNFLPGTVNHVQPTSPAAIYSWIQATPGLYDNSNFNYATFYNNTFGVSQATESAYAQLNFSQDKLRGNIGVRVVRTDTNSSTFVLGSATPGPTTAAPYTTVESIHIDPLPALNLSYNLTPQTVLRGALYEAIAYAPYNQMAPATFLNDQVLTGSGGNAQLEPYKSINLNLAAEWYYAPESLLSTTFFHKQLINYIESGTSEELQFNSLFNSNPTLFATTAAAPGNVCNTTTGFCEYGITRPQNGGRATVDGLAMSLQQPFSDTGFGIRGNVTYSYGTTQTGGDLPYNSKESVSITPYFEKGPLAANLSYNWRAKYLAGGYVAGAPATYTDAYTELDATASYQITRNLAVVFDGLNLFDSAYKQYLTDPSLPTARYKSGRELLATLRLKL